MQEHILSQFRWHGVHLHKIFSANLVTAAWHRLDCVYRIGQPWRDTRGTETGAAHLPVDVLDNGDDALPLLELSAGIAKLKGTARTFDLLSTQHRILTRMRVSDLARHARDNVGSADGCNEPNGLFPR